MEIKEVKEGLYYYGGDYYTKNYVPGKKVYGEKLLTIDGVEYRRWDAFRSKLAGALKKGLKDFPFSKKAEILYLGASTGTTVSHLSDICEDGVIYAVEHAPQMMEKLMKLAERRDNIVPILADARMPTEYEDIGEVGVLYQDVAQPDQVRILLLNERKFLKDGGSAMLCLKTHSIDVTKEKEETLKGAKEELKTRLSIEEVIDLDPYDKEHYFIAMRK
ncbi:MAG: fibrillarin-like rRNA/tRNA 2'-O-methyltransferase [Methanobacteriota archaeon]|nr:MAG: fibrillarin-like rRNA/tRNA 2'-O-methyltransferase [Euryarchaeota archaeon]